MTENQEKSMLIKIWFYASVAGVIWIILKLLSGPLFPFAVAVTLTGSLQGTIEKWTKKRNLKKKPAAIVFMSAVYIFILGIFVFFIYLLYGQLIELLRELPLYTDALFENFMSFKENIGRFIKKIPAFNSTDMVNIENVALQKLGEQTAVAVTDFIGSLAAFVPDFLFSSVIVVITGAYLAKDHDEISDYIRKRSSEKLLKILLKLKGIFKDKIGKMAKGYLIIIIMTFSELFIGLSFLGIKRAIIISAITAAVDILPVLGSGTVLIPWSVFSALSGDPKKALGLVILYSAITIIRNFAEPKIIGEKIGVHPVIMLASVFLGLKFFGFAGIILMPLTAVIAKNLLEIKNFKKI